MPAGALRFESCPATTRKRPLRKQRFFSSWGIGKIHDCGASDACHDVFMRLFTDLEASAVNTRQYPRRSSRLYAPWLLLACLASSCASERTLPPQAQLEAVRGVIGEVYEGEAGAWVVSLPPSQRGFTIHPDYSPKCRSLVARARAFAAAGARVDATVWIRDPELGKAKLQGGGVPGPPWVLVGLRELPAK